MDQPKPDSSDSSEAHDPFKAFDAFRAGWENRADEVFRSGLDYLASLEELPCPDGQLLDFVERLAGAGRELKRHAPALVTLIEKQNPYLQEAGLRIVRGLITGRGAWFPNDALPERLEGALIALWAAPDLDDWVAESLLDFYETARRLSVRLRDAEWRAALSSFIDESERRRATARDNPPQFFPSGRIMRNRAVFPSMRAKQMLADWRPPA